jgi:hypothetical protein
MAQIPIISGIYTDNGPDFRQAYPVNMEPVPVANGISGGYLRPADGLIAQGTGPGIDRGGINWNGVLYRVMGTKLVSISSTNVVTILGDVGGSTDLVIMDYSFDYLGIVSGGNIYFWNGTTLTIGNYPGLLVTLGPIIDFCFIDGRFMLTDGARLYVTNVGDPFTINPFAYQEPVADPDPVSSLLRLRNEVYAINRNTIEVYESIGGSAPFPFSVIDGAQIQKGAIGVQGSCVFMEMLAFIGSGRNEAPAVYLGSAAVANKVSTQEIDEILATYTEQQLSLVKLEPRNDKSQQFLYIHLPDRTLVYDAAASAAMEQPVWFVLVSTIDGFAQYRARNFVWIYDKWTCGDPQSNSFGYMTDTTSHHWGEIVRWEFGTAIVYNESKGAIFHQLELVALTGRVALGQNPWISTSYSYDGRTWSQNRAIQVGSTGQTQKRLVWFQQGHMRNWRVQRFNGDSQAHLSFARLEAQLEPLAY